MALPHFLWSPFLLRTEPAGGSFFAKVLPAQFHREKAQTDREHGLSFTAHCRRPPASLLDLGCGGGHNAACLKASLRCTLIDLSPSCSSNPKG